MKIRSLFLTAPASTAIIFLAFANFVFGAMPIPETTKAFEYEPVRLPVLSEDPSQARPVAVGEVAEEGSTLNLHIGIKECDGPVDIYVGLQATIFPDELFVFAPNGGLQPVSQSGLVPWKVGVSALVEESFFQSDIPINALPPGVYTLLLAVTPGGSFQSLYLWATSFLISGFSVQEVEAAMVTALGPEEAFQALWLALDDGYSLEQIVAAAMNWRLQFTGPIYGFSGKLLDPAGLSPDIFAGLEDLENGVLTVMNREITNEKPSLENIKKIIERIKGITERILMNAALSDDEKEKRIANLTALTGILIFLCHGYPPETIADLLVSNYGLKIKVRTDGADRTALIFVDDRENPIEPPGPKHRVCDLNKSISPLKVELREETTPKGEASASARAKASERFFTATVTGGTGPYKYHHYWGDSKTPQEIFNPQFTNTASHAYTAPKTYNLMVRVVDTSDGKEANSPSLAIQIDPPPVYTCWVDLNHVSAKYSYPAPDLSTVTYGDSYTFISKGSLDGPQFTGSIVSSSYSGCPECTGHLNMRIDLESLKASDIDAKLSHDRGGVTLKAAGHVGITLGRDSSTGIISGWSGEGTGTCQYIDFLESSRKSEDLIWVSYACNQFTSLYISCQEE